MRDENLLVSRRCYKLFALFGFSSFGIIFENNFFLLIS